MFNKKDQELFFGKNISESTILEQISNFEKGFPFVDLIAPATIGNGIISFTDEETDNYIHLYNKQVQDSRVIKFVPASGAATRMFKNLFEFTGKYDGSDYQFKKFLEDQSFDSAYTFISGIQNFAFFYDLLDALDQNGKKLDNCLESRDYNCIINTLLSEDGLGYSQLPKALIKFHNYDDGPRMALEEHLVESASYCSINKTVDIHFTISPEHEEKFLKAIEYSIKKYEKQLGVTFNLSYSFQKPSTDTIAVDMDNKPFRNQDGSILFRPGGHGALIQNLNDIDSDIIFIKNIDNIVPDRFREPTNYFKKVIGGYLLFLRNETFGYLTILEKGNVPVDQLHHITDFAIEYLNIDISKDFNDKPAKEKENLLFEKMNRPIRVCGMVKNEGEPGGGPFWVKDRAGEISLQIVEMSQINANDPQQMALVSKATHFNPVDLVCAVNDYKGNKFDLTKYIDPATGFISTKSKDGKNLKAQELPGLWNGAMAHWITVFVETPIITFNPVKTINDLLRPNHQ